MRLDYLLAFIFQAVAIVIGAKYARDWVLRRRGYNVNELVTAKRSVGAATTQAGYLIGVSLGFLGAIPAGQTDQSFLASVGAVALAGVMAIALQLAADFISDRQIFRSAEAQAPTPKTTDSPAAGGKALDEETNVALAVGKAAVSLATGLVLRGAMAYDGGTFFGRIAWFGVGQGLMVLAVLFYCRLTPYDDLGEIKRNNLAAAFPIVGILVAVGLLTEAAVAGKQAGSVLDASLGIAKFLGVSLLLITVLRRITGWVLLPKVKLAAAIVTDKNVAAGVQEGVSFVLASLIVTFFLR